MVTIYSSSGNTKRLDFVGCHLFNNILGTEFQITSDKPFYLSQTGPCINYSEENLNHGLWIFPRGILFETGIHPVEDLNVSEWKGLFCFFFNGKGDIPFDLFAAAFYLLTLYEEYFPVKSDEHGRFDHNESLLLQNNVLEIPVIDRWAYLLKDELGNTEDFKLREYRAISTYDIDHPFLYRYKGLIKNTGGLLRDLLKRNFKGMKDRLSVQLRLLNDPYMTAIQNINTLHSKWKRPYYLFILLGKRGKYGRTTLYSPKTYYRHLRGLDLAQIGSHPSYDTFRNLAGLLHEKTQLEYILKKGVNISRQHFLRMQTPETFQELHLAGFREDFTLAFAHAPGFRSGTAVPYYFYDLQKEEPTSLLIRPTVMMDSTLIFHQKCSPEAALQKIKSLIDACKQSGGDYLSLWHNSNLACTPEENPWINVFIESSQYAISMENH
jgi:hypothetical protein